MFVSDDALTIESLERWEFFGAQWRIVTLGENLAIIDRCTCTGEPVERRESADSELIAFLRASEQGRAGAQGYD